MDVELFGWVIYISTVCENVFFSKDNKYRLTAVFKLLAFSYLLANDAPKVSTYFCFGLPSSSAVGYIILDWLIYHRYASLVYDFWLMETTRIAKSLY